MPRSFSFLALSLMLISMLSVATQAQTLWQETTKGMSPDQVLELVDGAHLVEGDKSNLNSGAIELVRLDHIDIVSKSFQAKFYFLDNALDQVHIEQNDKSMSFGAAKTTFNSLLVALRAKYGNEISFEKPDNSMFKIGKAEWLNEQGSNVSLVVMKVGTSPTILKIVYQTRLLKESNKL